jgi:hypothetical protein
VERSRGGDLVRRRTDANALDLDGDGLLPLIKLLEYKQIKATFWYRKGEVVTGIPHYLGFDIDTGEVFTVNGKQVALHDFRAIMLVNPDNPVVAEHVMT